MPPKLSPVYSLAGFRRRLASINALPQFAILGVFSGFVTGLVILAFRALIELPLEYFLPGNDFENFEGLSSTLHFLLPVCGAIVIALMMAFLSPATRRVGVVHVLERLSRHQGHMTLSNALIQFLAGGVALLSGQSSGREGPAIHLGAASSALLGTYLELPNNSIRVLVGCGAAAAISASFNTPIAGVIFSMEVIMMEYTLAGFIPVMLSAVTATVINQTVYGNLPAFDVPALSMQTFYDLPFLVVEGFVIGLLAAAFIKLMRLVYERAPANFSVRILVAGFITGAFGVMVPSILGVGYDTVNSALVGELSVTLLLSACLIKLAVSAVSVGLGMPAGLIGPTLFIGATAGGLLGILGNFVLPEYASSPGFYVMLGMGAMMGAALQAPLSALMAVMELTHNPNIIMPAMLVIVVANVTASHLLKQKSVFMTQMEMQGLEFRHNPLSMALNRASVASVMERNFERVPRVIPWSDAKDIIRNKPHWVLVDGDDGPSCILRTEDLASHVDTTEEHDVDLLEIPATRKDVKPVLLQATLHEAQETLERTGVEALYVKRINVPMLDSVAGIVTKESIDSYYLS